MIASHSLTGIVEFAEPLAASRVVLRLPVASLTIDEPALRAQAGADFASEVPDSAREGTRRNLLSPALLDGADFPEILLESTTVTPLPEGLRLTVEARVRGQRSSFEVPVALRREGATLVATGQASYHATYDYCTSKFLTQAGVKHDYVPLASVGILGNGHMEMLEMNNLTIAAFYERWLASKLTIESDQLSLISQDLPEVKEVKRVIDMVGGAGYLQLALRSTDEKALKKLADSIHDTLTEAKNEDFILGVLRRLQLGTAPTAAETTQLTAIGYSLPTTAAAIGQEINRLDGRLRNIESFFVQLTQLERDIGIDGYLGF